VIRGNLAAWPALDIGPGALQRASRDWHDISVLTTPSPWAVAGPLLARGTDAVLIGSNDRSSLEAYAKRATRSETVVGIGSGLVMDAAKYVAKRNRQHLVQVPTTASNNACFTRTAWIMEAGVRTPERECPVPCAIIVDRELLSAAPVPLNRAGIAEILCSHTALFDWRLAYEAGRPVDWDQTLEHVTRCELEALEALAPQVATGDVLAIEEIIKACARFAPWFSSHPHARFNAGSEHIFAWALEGSAGRRLVHGETVALGIILMSLLQGNAPEWAASIIRAANVSFHPEDIGVTWAIVDETLRSLPGRAQTLSWYTAIETLGSPDQATHRLARLGCEGRDYVDELKRCSA
jgi:glycerol-1-phosphate dehydrogenase [NAD(P)+]